MDQGTIVATDDRRVWTPWRALLVALAAIAGGFLLSIALAGPARAASPTTPPDPAATGADTSLVGRVTGALTDVTRTVLAPVDGLVARAEAGSTAGAAPSSSATAPAIAPEAAAPAALDSVLAEMPPATTPLWREVIGPQPIQQLATPLAVVLRPLAPGVADLLAPLLPAAPSSAPAAIATSAAFPVAALPALLVVDRGAPPASNTGTAPGPVRDVDHPAPTPRAPLGTTDDAVMSASGGAMSPAVLLAFPAALLLVAAAARRRGWTLPSAPSFGADVSPD